MKIIKKSEAIHVDKSEGTKVDYYLRNEYEIHYNEQMPESTQTWHHHEKISETLFIIDGELTVKWKENNIDKTQIISTGDLIETETTPHTFMNHTSKIIKFLVIKQIFSGENKTELLKTDKVVDL